MKNIIKKLKDKKTKRTKKIDENNINDAYAINIKKYEE